MTDFPQVPGVPTELSVEVGRVLSDNDYGSFRVSAALSLTLSPDAKNIKGTFDAIAAWLEANVGKTIKAQKAAYDQLQPEPEYGIGDERAVPPPRSPVEAPVAPVAQSSGQMVTETWQNPAMTIEFTKGGDKYLRVKGGKWLKFGCPAWAETIPFTYFVDWEPGNEYRLPDGLTEAVVQMNEKGQPKKVIEFR